MRATSVALAQLQADLIRLFTLPALLALDVWIVAWLAQWWLA